MALADLFDVMSDSFFVMLLAFIFLVWGYAVYRKYRIRFSFYVDVSLGREPNDGIHVEYHQKMNSLAFFGNNLDFIIYIPSDHLWKNEIPQPFRDERGLILERIREAVSRERFKKIQLRETNSRGDLSGFFVRKQPDGRGIVTDLGTSTRVAS